MTATEAVPARVAGGRRPPIALLVALFAGLRPRQWLKNGLVIGAPVAAGRLLQGPVAVDTAVAFGSFCLAASAGYLVNDVHDVAEDRMHPRKRRRPVASGELPRRVALLAAAVLSVGSLAVALLCSPAFAALIVGYLAVTFAYTLRLRREPVLELVVVSSGFVLRAVGGGLAAGIAVSSWFLLVAGFGSLFMVSGKRYAELVGREREPGGRAALATYSEGFLRFVWTCAATLTLVAYALWANEVYLVREDGSWALWSLVPFLLLVLRYALDVDRGRTEAPEEVLLGNRALLALALVWVVMVAIGAGGMDGGG